MKETREDRFVRLAEARVNKAIHIIRLIGNLSSPVYEYSEGWVDQIIAAISGELCVAEDRLRKRQSTSKKRFRLGDDPEAADAVNADVRTPSRCPSCGIFLETEKPTPWHRYCRFCGGKLNAVLESEAAVCE